MNMDIVAYLSQNAVTYVELIATVTLGLLVKDFVGNFVAGCAFWLSKDFREGDHVIIDGEQGVVVKIGIRKTIFGIVSEHGYVWRYVLNTEIKRNKLEKIIREEVKDK
jgi:small-conductance mechanosensitive channel